MTRDPDHDVDQRLDDERTARLVRDVIDGWAMPPVRLDQPGWRDRVRSARRRRIEALRGSLGRLGRAAAAATALTVVAALAGIYLTRPPADPGPGSTGSHGPVATDPSRPTPLPKLLIEGELPSPAQLLVEIEYGDFARVDLTTGSLGTRYDSSHWASAMRARADGSVVCLCVSESDYAVGAFTTASVELVVFHADGSIVSRSPIGEFSGEPDPRDVVTALGHPPHVSVAAALSADGSSGYVGWSTRAYPIWRSGLLVVDLETGAVTTVALPDAGAGEGDERVVVEAPSVAGEGGGGLLVGQAEYRYIPARTDEPYAGVARAWQVLLAGRGTEAGETVPIPGAAGCGEVVTTGGITRTGPSWIACWRGGSAQINVRRLDAAGRPVGDDVGVPSFGDIEGSTSAVSADGSTLYLWHPMTLTLTRIDLKSGVASSAQATRPAAAAVGPLDALGRWLAPGAAAKVILRSGIALSPDGSRAYALGLSQTSDGSLGSAGVLVFDVTSLAVVDTWRPTADFISLAVSADGRSVYAAGLPGADPSGRRAPYGASITVFDATDGAVRLVAGQLGSGFLTFPRTTVE